MVLCIFTFKISQLCTLLTENFLLVDASRAGMGEIEVTVQALNKKIPVKVINTGNDVYRVIFMPKDPVKHLVFVTFSKEAVPGKCLPECLQY